MRTLLSCCVDRVPDQRLLTCSVGVTSASALDEHEDAHGDAAKPAARGGRPIGARGRGRRWAKPKPPPARMATGKEWRDDCGQSLAWLDWAGQTEQAAAVRARHAFTSTAASRQDSPADECAPAQAVGATRAQIANMLVARGLASRVNDMQEGAGGRQLHTGIEEHVGQLTLAFGDSGSPEASVADAQPGSPTSAAMTDDLRASREAWTGDLVGQALQMSYDTHTRQMCVPRDGQRVYNGYVRSRIASRKARTSDSLYVCWFEDHSTEEVSESLLRQCVTTADIETRTVVQSMTPEAVCVVAACRHVWGQDTMPPCVRDASDGVSRSCALLVFDYKTVYVNQYQVTDIIDDRASSVVERPCSKWRPCSKRN